MGHVRSPDCACAIRGSIPGCRKRHPDCELQSRSETLKTLIEPTDDLIERPFMTDNGQNELFQRNVNRSIALNQNKTIAALRQQKMGQN